MKGDCDGQISMFDILNPKKFDTSGFLKDIVMRGSGFENGKERIYNLYQKDMSNIDRAKAIKNEYGQGGCGWPQKESGLHGYDSFNGKGIRAEYYIENMESKEIIYTWVEVEKMIHGLIDNEKYYKQKEPPKTDSRKPFDHSCYNCKYLDRSKKKITGTHRYTDGQAYVSLNMLNAVMENEAVGLPITKLAHYEDLEEKGLLVEIPCKVGDTVYIIGKCKDFPPQLDGSLYDSCGGLGDATGYYCPYEQNCPFDTDDCDKVKDKKTIFEDTVVHICIEEDCTWFVCENSNGWNNNTCFGKTIFSTQSEAEQALAERQKNEDIKNT